MLINCVGIFRAIIIDMSPGCYTLLKSSSSSRRTAVIFFSKISRLYDIMQDAEMLQGGELLVSESSELFGQILWAKVMPSFVTLRRLNNLFSVFRRDMGW